MSREYAIVVVFVSIVWTGSILAQTATDANASPVPAVRAPVASPNEPAKPLAESSQAGQIIKSIEFEGNKHFKDGVLRQRLGFELGDRLDPFLAEGGRLTIAEVYRKIGYAFVEVTLDRDRMASGNLLYKIMEGPRVEINCVRFVGNESVSSGTLAKIVKTKAKEWLVWSHYYTEDAVDEDVQRLQDFYYDRGYLDYKIAAEKEFTANRKGVCVTFIIAEGPVYRIGEIRFSGNTRFSREQLLSPIESQVGKVYLRPTARRDATVIAKMYREQGYVDAEVRHRAVFGTQSGEDWVTVEFEIVEGGQFHIGRIDITGNEKTQDKVVRRVLDEYGFTPGELYNASIAPKEGGGLLERYVRGRVIEEAMIRPVPAPEGSPEGTKDVHVDIKEGMSGMIMPSVGVSSDSGLIGQFIYRQQNFDITDWPDNLWDFLTMQSFRGAGQSLSVALQPGTQYSQYSVEFVDPYWRDRPVSLDVLGRSWRRYRESWDEERLKGFVGFEKRLPSHWNPSLGVRVESVQVENLDYDVPREIRAVEGRSDLFGLKLGLDRLDVDDPFTPSRGQAFGVDYEQVTGDFDFGILEGHYTHYWPLYEDVLGRKTVLAGRLLAGTVLGDAPPFEKFYAGGASGPYALRGFEYRGVSPRGLQSGAGITNPERKDPIGSDWIFLASAEITVPLIGDNFSLLLFADSGTVETGSYRLSIGTGVQISVPQLLGQVPMRFELATPLRRDDDDETQVFSFSAGGIFGF